MLHELCSDEEEEEAESYLIENESVGILINNHLPLDYSAQGYSEEDLRLSGHNYSGHNSPYQSNSPHISLAQGCPPSTGFDSDRHCPQLTGSGPSSLPAMGRYCVCVLVFVTMKGKFIVLLLLLIGYYSAYQSSTSVMGMAAPQMTFAVDRSRDFSDGRDDSSPSNRTRSRSFSMQRHKPLDIEQVTSTGRRRKSLCNIGTSMSDPINVLNALGEKFSTWWNISIYFSVTLGMMNNINNANVKRVNSLIFVSEGKLFKVFLNLSAYNFVNRTED